jgi:hypothetical protein
MKSRSPPQDAATTSDQRLEVSALHTEAKPSQSCLLLKLTDECNAAIHKALSDKLPIRVNFGKNSASVEIGRPGSETIRFQCMLQKQDSPVDAICLENGKRGGGYGNVTPLSAKLQVQATDKTFAETREKAKKLADEEQKKKTKDMTGHRQHQRSAPHRLGSSATTKRVGLSMGSLSTSRSSEGPLKNGQHSAASTSSRLSLSAKTGSNTSQSQSSQSRTPVPNMRSELLKRPLRKRVIHLCATARYTSPDEMLSRLKQDGIPPDESSTDNSSRFNSILEEVGDFKGSRILLKSNYYNEVDRQWPWFNPEEKSSVRRMLSNTSVSTASNFAPTRKSGAAPPQAPVAAHNSVPSTGNTIRNSPYDGTSENSLPNSGSSDNSLDGFPTTNGSSAANPSIGASALNRVFKKRVANTVERSSPAAKKRELPLEEEPPVEAKKRREAHKSQQRMPSVSPLENSAPMTANINEKSVQNFSPPDKKTIFRAINASEKTMESKTHNQSKMEASLSATMEMMGPASNESDSLKSASPDENDRRSGNSLTMPSKPTRDWMQVFDEIKSVEVAAQYHQLFNADYAVYQECFNILSKVSSEFNELEQALRRAPRNTPDHDRVEQMIQAKFAEYQRDPEFLHTRQRHSDLRAKLEVLKQRISAWECAQRESLCTKQRKKFTQNYRQS